MIRVGALYGDAGEAVGEALAVLVGGMLEETTKVYRLVGVEPWHGTRGVGITHAGALVV